MADKRILYDFCPRCGGLMKDKVCLACGYEKKPGEQGSVPDFNVTPAAADFAGAEGGQKGKLYQDGISGNGAGGAGSSFQENALQTPVHKNHRGLIIGICAGGLIFLLLLCLAIYLIVSGWRTANSGEKEFLVNELSDDSAAFSDGEEQEYVPDPSDEYYVEFADAVRDDLSYGINWEEYHTESADGSDYFGAVYPEVTGNFPNAAQVNEALKEMGLRSLPGYQYLLEEGAGSCEVYSVAYVTLMDEEILSVLYADYIYINDACLPQICDLNVNVRTGEVLDHEDMISYTPKLAKRVCSQNEAQNSTDLEGIGLTQEDVLGLLQSEDGVAFYTPVGLELGFNYYLDNGNYGWLTVTIKDYEEYR